MINGTQNLAPDLVQELPARAEFYREGGRDLVRISYVGSKDTLVKKVRPEHMAQFREAWCAFCDGQPLAPRTGTPLTQVPGINDELARHYVHQNVHTAEELGALNDIQCQGLGHGTLTLRAAARKLVSDRDTRAKLAAHDRVSEAMSKVTAAPDPQASADIADLKAQVAGLAASVAGLVELLKPAGTAGGTPALAAAKEKKGGQDARGPGKRP